MSGNKPVVGNGCTMCYRCISHCPKQYYIVDEKEWKIPRGYTNTTYKLSYSTIELLENTKNGRHEYELPKAIIVMSPGADLSESGDSYDYNLHKDIMFGVDEGCQLDGYAIDNRYAGNTDLQDKYLSPVYADYKNFPNMLIQVGMHEMLESDSITIYNKAKEVGVDVTFTRY